MRRSRGAVCSVCVVWLAAVPCGAVDEQFTFYGLQFGMTKAEVGAKQLARGGATFATPGTGCRSSSWSSTARSR